MSIKSRWGKKRLSGQQVVNVDGRLQWQSAIKLNVSWQVCLLMKCSFCVWLSFEWWSPLTLVAVRLALEAKLPLYTESTSSGGRRLTLLKEQRQDIRLDAKVPTNLLTSGAPLSPQVLEATLKALSYPLSCGLPKADQSSKLVRLLVTMDNYMHAHGS